MIITQDRRISVALKFREAEETIKISMTSSAAIIGSPRGVLLALLEEARGRKRGEARTRERRHKVEDVEISSPKRAKTERRRGKGHRNIRNIVSEWNGVDDGGTEESGFAGRTRREGEAPRIVPGGPRPVETAQRLKARGIILL